MKPILFSGPMVKAILEGRKNQTRRVINARNVRFEDGVWQHDIEDDNYALPCPYGVPGDRLWVKETLQYTLLETQVGSNPADVLSLWGHIYAADGVEVGPIPDRLPENFKDLPNKTVPSIFMPRWASRIILTLEDVRVQRLQDISEADALAEGVFGDEIFTENCVYAGDQIGPKECFANLWNSINGKKHPWSENPWVWTLTFSQVKR